MKYISVISILFYTLFFGIGPGSIPFMITAELFTQGTRPVAMSVSVFANWFSNFGVGLTFPLMKVSFLFLLIKSTTIQSMTNRAIFFQSPASFAKLSLSTIHRFPRYILGFPVQKGRFIQPSNIDYRN